MRRAWTVLDNEDVKRTDIAVVVAETKNEALELLRDEMQDGDEYWTFVVIDDSIYQFAPGYGYKGKEWDCDDLRQDMWDTDASDGVFELAELPCYCMGEEYDAEDFFKHHDLIRPMNRKDFKRKFSWTPNYNFVLMDESIDIAEYLSNGTVLLHSDWNGEYYCPDEKHYYYPVDIPISYYYDDDDEKMEPDQYETVGFILETY